MTRQLPGSGETFLDHVAHFTPRLDEAATFLGSIGFQLTPYTAQQNRTPEGMVPAGMANRCVMLREGYLELLTSIADTELARQFKQAIKRHVGLHLIAFTTADAEAAHERMTKEGFGPQPPVALTRKVALEGGGEAEARFTVLRLPPGVMPEGRVQMLSHHTEKAVWQDRWLAHGNGVRALSAILVAVEDPREAAERFGRFTGKAPERRGARWVLRLDRGLCIFAAHGDVAEAAPWATPVVGAPWIVATAIGSDDPAMTEARFAAGGLTGETIAPDQTVYRMPPGIGGFMTICPYGADPAWAG